MSPLIQFLEYCDLTISSSLNPEIENAAALQSKRKELLLKIDTSRQDINKRAANRVTRKELMKEVSTI